MKNSRNSHEGVGRAVGFVLGLLGAATLVTGCGEKKSSDVTGTDVPAVATVSTTAPQAQSAPEVIGPPSPGMGAPAATPDPAQARSAWREGVSLFESGDYKSAASALRVAAEGRSNEPYAHYLFGLALWKSGETGDAEKALSRAADLDGASVKTRVNLARVRMDLGDPKGAMEAADAALALEADSADSLHQRGRALAALGRTDEALETLQKARIADPGNGYVANTLGHVLLQAGRFSEALPHLEAAQDALPEVGYVRNNLGMVLERLGRTEEALAEFRAAVEAGDSEGKAAASVARLEPVVNRILARRGDPGTKPQGTQGTPVTRNDTPADRPEK